jgi:hypothetical protein
MNQQIQQVLTQQLEGKGGDFVSFGLITEASITEEPGAGKLYAGICAGAVG